MINVKKKPIELTKWKTEWSHLSDIEIPGILDSTELTIDIGENCSDALDILDKRVDTETRNAPRGLLTPFGWCITGRLGQKSSGNPLCMLISSFEDIDLGESAERV